MQMKKPTLRQTQAIETRAKLYRIAFDLMEKKGFDNITIEEISKKAGVSVGAFYHYFKSKNDILFEIYNRADVYFKENVENKLTSQNSLDQIVEYFLHYARYSSLTGIEFTKHLYNTQNEFFIRKDRYMQIVLENIIRSGQENSEIKTDMNSTEITEFLFIVARGVVFDWCLYDGTYTLEDKMESVFKKFIVIFASDSKK